MSAIERITKAAHLIDMNDIIREGNPTLRAVAEEVTFPLSDQEIILGEKMMQFLKTFPRSLLWLKNGAPRWCWIGCSPTRYLKTLLPFWSQIL